MSSVKILLCYNFVNNIENLLLLLCIACYNMLYNILYTCIYVSTFMVNKVVHKELHKHFSLSLTKAKRASFLRKLSLYLQYICQGLQVQGQGQGLIDWS